MDGVDGTEETEETNWPGETEGDGTDGDETDSEPSRFSVKVGPHVRWNLRTELKIHGRRYLRRERRRDRSRRALTLNGGTIRAFKIQ